MGPEQGIYVDRVREHTAPPVNARIEARTEENIRRYTGSHVGAISRRLEELDREWDVERGLMVWFAVVGGAALEFGLRKHRGWLFLLRTQLAFLVWHAAVGWCPPVPLLRRLGFRTQKEIGVERRALMEHLEARLPRP